MKKLISLITAIILSCGINAFAQGAAVRWISGVVKDASTNEKLSFITVQYEGTGVGNITDNGGNFKIERHTGKQWQQLTFSAVGYRTQVIKLSRNQRILNVAFVPDNVQLSEVIIKPKNEHYRRKDNPAVALMKNVIKHKRGQILEQKNYYSYNKYQRMKTSLNDITPERLNSPLFQKYKFLGDQVEESSSTSKKILPLSLLETVQKVYYRKNPEKKQTITLGKKSNGLQDFFYTGNSFSTIINDVFADINIYDNNIRLLQRRFVSPIADKAVTFYKYYIMDTIRVEQDSCIDLSFVPYNSQDFGFTGHIYIIKDSTYAVKRCTMNLPIRTGVNFIEHMDIKQDYIQQSNGLWALKNDEITASLSLDARWQGVEIRRTTTYSNYNFDPIPKSSWKETKLKDVMAKGAKYKDDLFWTSHRLAPLSKSELNMEKFEEQIRHTPQFGLVMFGMKLLVENYLETGNKKNPSKFDIGPVSSMISSNEVEGTRLRMGGNSTPALDDRLFLSGYAAYGIKDEKLKYSGRVQYSFHDCNEFFWELPEHYIAVNYMYDVKSPQEKWAKPHDESIFASINTSPVDQLSYVKNAEAIYKWESETGFSYKIKGKWRNDRAAGALHYVLNDVNATEITDFTTSEVELNLRYAPDEKVMLTKKRRRQIQHDAPIFSLSHSHSFKNVLGSDYRTDHTDLSIESRFWLGRWGRIDVLMSAGAEWNKVPFPLLDMPPTNSNYSTQHGSFNLANNMEFLSDRYASVMIYYDPNGRFLNRIPLLKRLKWREIFSFKSYWGDLTDKNNPYKSDDLFNFPVRDGKVSSFILEPNRPYMEASAGIYNIFKLLKIEYVHRFSYLNNPSISKNGVRFSIMLQF